MKRREFVGKSLKFGGAAIAANSFLGRSIAKPDHLAVSNSNGKNVLLIISDDHGIDQLGCFGNKIVKTPNLDKMASLGVRFTNSYCAAPSCSASRGAILSGLYPHQNGQFGHQHNWHHFSLFDWVETIPSLLKKSGYKTGLIGKLHVASQKNLNFDFVVPGKDIKDNRDAKKIAEKAGDFFEESASDPFFLLVGYSDPHRSEQGMTEMRNVENFSGFGNNEKYDDVPGMKFDPRDIPVPDFLPDIPEVRSELADQYESISRMDTGIGWIIDNLRKSGKYDQTLIIYLSDNGIPFPGAKTNLYDAGVRVPMIINSPTITAKGNVNNSMISFVDLLPTILDWCGIQPPKYKIPGKSFLGILNQEDDETRTEIYNSHTFHEITMYYPMRSVRTKKFRYILNLFHELEFPFATDLYTSKTWRAMLERKITMLGKRKTTDYLFRPAEELYDVENDPAESQNLAGNPKYEKVLSGLRKKLYDMRIETEDFWLINDNYKSNKEIFTK